MDPRKGRFRSFLLVAANHFLANQWDHAHAVKRGGRIDFVPLDGAAAEERFALELTASRTPDQEFERRWALALIERVLGRLRAEFRRDGKEAQFEQLKVFLTGEERTASYAELAARSASTEAALKMAVQRMRHRCLELLHDEIAQTLASADNVAEEIRCLFAALRN